MIKFGLGLLWFLVGCILATPYTWLANGGFTNFFLTVCIAPFGALVLYFTYMSQLSKWGNGFFWEVAAYVCLPVIMNGASLLVKRLGYETIASYIFGWRYFSLVVVPLLIVAYFAIIIEGKILWQRFRGHPAPTASATTN